MNIKDRETMVKKGNARNLYGGRYEPLVHFGMFLAVLAYVYFGFEELSLYEFNTVLSFIFAFITIPSCLSYFLVARIQKLQNYNEAQFSSVKAELIGLASHVKNRGKYFVELIMDKNTHLTVFTFKGSVYAVAFKYGRRGWHYAPFFSGETEVEGVRKMGSRH